MGCGRSKLKNNSSKSMLKAKPPQSSKFKIVLLGNASVGKTSIAARYCSNNSAQDYGPTVGGVYYKK
jgi:GTPase SAR1 family protein